MSNRTFTSEELVALLERFRAERAGAKTASDTTDAQVQLLLARIGALTDALRGAESNEATRVASRLLLSDLAFVAGQFRANANAMRASLAKVLDDLRDALTRFDASPAAPVSQPSSFDRQPRS